MRIVKYFIFFVFAIVFCHCKTIDNIKKHEPIIELEKMKCRGACHVFTFTIAADGIAYFNGIENVEMIGTYRSKMEKEQLGKIIKEFDKADFFSFKDSYKSHMMDLQTKFITYKKNGLEKRIKAYDNIPKKLIFLIAELDALIQSLKWEKLNRLNPTINR